MYKMEMHSKQAKSKRVDIKSQKEMTICFPINQTKILWEKIMHMKIEGFHQFYKIDLSVHEVNYLPVLQGFLYMLSSAVHGHMVRERAIG